jgi:hypothetical protein
MYRIIKSSSVSAASSSITQIIRPTWRSNTSNKTVPAWVDVSVQGLISCIEY